jgi:glycosyltransferase involved in cell wall biosynthesis
MKDIAVLLICYKRPIYLKRALESLENNTFDYSKVDLYADIEYSEIQEDIVDVINTSSLKFNITKRNEFLGQERNFQRAISQLIINYDAIIVLEDDFIYHKDSIDWLYNNLLGIKDSNKYMTVSLGVRPWLEGNSPWRFVSWGWGIWADKWSRFRWELPPTLDSVERELLFTIGTDLPTTYDKVILGRTKSFATRMVFSHLTNNLQCLTPKQSKVSHIGNIGEHYNLLRYFSIRKYLRFIKLIYLRHIKWRMK